MKINIIDLTSTEFNRGSFCYAPYLCYNGLTADNHEVTLIEAFRSEDLDDIPEADAHIVTLWSYPQIEAATMLAQFLPFQWGKDNVYFIGYRPLIQHLGLRYVDKLLGFDPMSDSDFLKAAMLTYPLNYYNFKRLLLSDCDMHIKNKEKGEKVYPLFTSYGCPHGCSFCPSSKNCGRHRTVLSIEETFKVLDLCENEGIRHIHFTDEDFFFDIDRAYEILRHLKGKGFHLIALGAAKVVREYIEKYGNEAMEEAGLEVIEIGFESASPNISDKMGAGKSLSDCEALAKIQDKITPKIFWLVLTFFIGETIETLNKTGYFMRRNGFNMDQVVGRLRTNGTIGGLGQFFQAYHGTPIFKTLIKAGEASGMFITDRAVRLLPSYLPHSFLYSKIRDIHPENYDAALPWLELYNIPADKCRLEDLKIGSAIHEYIFDLPMYTQIQNSITLAVLARMEVIT